jgi:hypothetical protein
VSSWRGSFAVSDNGNDNASMCLSKAVQRKIMLILEQGRRPADVYLQGVDIMLAKYRRARKADKLVRQVAELLAREDVTVGEFRAALDRYSPEG